ncbi:MAG: ABC-2 transporter permease [Candidatus Marinimicrobia bacterium]|nr:ABC-2 transporter permease [Candidatus Neomarinimicrobiota bacterium]
MFEIMKRDWILIRHKYLFLLPILSMSLVLLFPKADEGYFVIGAPVVFTFSVFVFIQDDTSLRQLLSMPFSRAGIARARFLSGWAFMGAGMVYIVVLGFGLGLIYPEALKAFIQHLDLKTLFTYLWVLSGITLIAYPVLFMFLGKGVQALIAFALGLNVLFGVYFLMRFNATGPDIFEVLKSLIISLQAYHTSPLNYLTSALTLLILNGINLKLCEWIFLKKEF